MPHTDLLQQTMVEQNMLLLIVEGLRNTLAWEVQDDDFARKLSTLRFITQSFQRHLERVLAIEEDDGYMGLASHSSLWLGHGVMALKQEHHQFRREAGLIVHRLENASADDPDSFSRICRDLLGLLDRLQAHDDREGQLMQEAFARDEGGEG